MKTVFRFCPDCLQFEECYTDDDPTYPGPHLLCPGCFKPKSGLTPAAPDAATWRDIAGETSTVPVHYPGDETLDPPRR